MATPKYEFQPKICLLSDTSLSVSNRYTIMQKKATHFNTDQASNKLFNKNDKQYIYGMLPVELMPAAYIPFRYDKIDENFYRLSKNNKIQLKHYNDVFEGGITETNFKDKQKELINELRDYLKKELNNPRSTFYTVEIESIMLYEILAFWLILLLILMKIFYTYYSSVYSYILFLFFVIILLFAIFWKMFYTLR
jgi:hypothetical protein